MTATRNAPAVTPSSAVKMSLRGFWRMSGRNSAPSSPTSTFSSAMAVFSGFGAELVPRLPGGGQHVVRHRVADAGLFLALERHAARGPRAVHAVDRHLAHERAAAVDRE